MPLSLMPVPGPPARVPALRIVAPDDYPPSLAGSPAEQKLRSLGDLTIYDSLAKDVKKLLDRVGDADVAIGIRGGLSRFTEDVLSECKQLKHISVWGTGVDHIDLDACKKLGIVVTNTPSYSSDTVAEGALALALSVARRIVENDRDLRQGRWAYASRRLVRQLCGKVLGVVGADVLLSA